MFLHQLKNREEKEKYFLKILKIEKKKRNEISFLEIEREKYGSFLFEIFSRSRLLSMSVLLRIGLVWCGLEGSKSNTVSESVSNVGKELLGLKRAKGSYLCHLESNY